MLTCSIRWLKCVALLDRVSKLALSSPPGTDIPVDSEGRLRGAHQEIHMGLYQHIESMGEDGINPVRRMELAAAGKTEKPLITPHTIALVCLQILLKLADRISTTSAMLLRCTSTTSTPSHHSTRSRSSQLVGRLK